MMNIHFFKKSFMSWQYLFWCFQKTLDKVHSDFKYWVKKNSYKFDVGTIIYIYH
jgi:hypothetical protein